MTTPIEPTPVRRLARRVFLAFLLTFVTARVLVILIMTRRIPDMFLHARGTHVHHLNYGTFILSAVGAVLVVVPQPNDQLRKLCALLYGCGMALTFDEFGMWLHLGGSYWQRGSFDAVIVLLSVFGWIAYLPRWGRMRSRHWTVAAITALGVITFYALLIPRPKRSARASVRGCRTSKPAGRNNAPQSISWHTEPTSLPGR